MTDLMPVLFIGHGSPMNAIEDNEFSREWANVGKFLPIPKAILCISAHWETTGTRVTAMPKLTTLYDFQGFPEKLYEKRYPAIGDPELARSIKKSLSDVVIHLDFGWGLDHGTWSVLSWMFPHADIPVLQLSLDFDQKPSYHYELGQKLKYLRKQGVLILGSGNMVHNLRVMVWEDTAFDWAVDFDERLAQAIRSGDHQALVAYESMGDKAQLAIPTNEHFLPLLYILGLREPTDSVHFFCDRVTLGSISMRSFQFG
jgi:4,5-DOPA dioxygenase extradiol